MGGSRRRKADWFEDLFGKGDPRPLWKRYDPARGLSLHDAAIFYGPDYEAEKYVTLRLEGYESEPDFDPWDDRGRGEYYVRNLHLRQAKIRLQTVLIEKLTAGELFATGYSDSAPLDQPATRILADRWRTLKAAFEQSGASAPGLVITGILVFSPQFVVPTAEKEVSRRGFSQAELRRWYQKWIELNQEEGRTPSREADRQAAAAEFGRPIPREVVRRLRRELAPEAWVRQGRRKNPVPKAP